LLAPARAHLNVVGLGPSGPMRACSYCRKLLTAAETVCPDDGSAWVEVAFDALPPELAARVRNARPFACGATGQLFRGVALRGEQSVVLKIFGDSVGAGIAERTRCKRELHKQAAIVHSHLPVVLDDGEVGGRLWLLREFVEGETLAVQLRCRGPLPIPEALAVVAQLASALDELHRQGLVHRDLKPGHVLLTPRPLGPPQVRLIDAGIAARLPGEALFESYGTPAYAAPEIAAGKPASFRSDLYSLGCLLYEMLSGSAPFTAPTIAAVLAAHRDLEPPALDADLPLAVRTLLDTLLAKEPKRRPFSARQVRRAIDAHLPANMPETTAARSIVPTPSAAPPAALPASASARTTASRVARNRSASSPDSTEELSIEDLQPAGAPEIPTKTQELDLVDLEQLPPNPRTQELDLKDIESVRPPATAPKTQELDLKDIESVRAPAPAPKTQELDLKDIHSVAPPAEPQIGRRSSSRAPAAAEPTPIPGSRHADNAATFAIEPRSQPPVAEQPIAAAPAPSEPEVAVVGDVAELADANSSGPRPSVQRSTHESDPDEASHPHHEVSDDSATPVPARRGRRPWALLGVAALLAVLAIGLKLAAKRVGDASSDDPQPAAAPSEPERTQTAAASEEHPNELTVPSVVVETPQPAAAPSALEPPQPTAAVAVVPSQAAPPEPAVAPPGSPAAPVVAPSGLVAPAVPPAAPPEPAAQAAADTKANAEPAGSQPVPNDQTGPQILPAAEAGKAFLHDGGAATPGGVVSYRPRLKSEIDYKTKGLQLYQAGKFREAAEAYERAAQKTPSDARAFAGLGASWLSAGEADRAILAYQRAVQLKPEVSGFQAALGRAYLTKGDRARAAAAYSKALALDPTNQAAKTGLASLKPR
jgi:serine/threonine protein kinase